MIVDVRAHGFSLTESILRHAESRMGASLGWASRWITRVTVWMDDINGDHGGEDKRSRASLQLRSGQTVIAEATRKNLYASINEVSDMLRRSLHRHLGRRRALHRHPRLLRELRDLRAGTATTKE